MGFEFAKHKIDTATIKEFRLYFPEACMFADNVKRDWKLSEFNYKIYKSLVLPQGDDRSYGAVEIKYMGKKFYYNLTTVNNQKIFFTYSVFLREALNDTRKTYELIYQRG